MASFGFAINEVLEKTATSLPRYEDVAFCTPEASILPPAYNKSWRKGYNAYIGRRRILRVDAQLSDERIDDIISHPVVNDVKDQSMPPKYFPPLKTFQKAYMAEFADLVAEPSEEMTTEIFRQTAAAGKMQPDMDDPEWIDWVRLNRIDLDRQTPFRYDRQDRIWNGLPAWVRIAMFRRQEPALVQAQVERVDAGHVRITMSSEGGTIAGNKTHSFEGWVSTIWQVLCDHDSPFRVAYEQILGYMLDEAYFDAHEQYLELCLVHPSSQQAVEDLNEELESVRELRELVRQALEGSDSAEEDEEWGAEDTDGSAGGLVLFEHLA